MQLNPNSIVPAQTNGGTARHLLQRIPPWGRWAALLACVVLLAVASSSSIFAGRTTGTVGRPPPLPLQARTHTPLATSTPPVATPTPEASGNVFGQLPAAWASSGRGDAEFLEAKNVAETFASHYETLDWRSQNTFTQATFAMTGSALGRFQQQDERENATFRKNFIRMEAIRVASIEGNKTRCIAVKQWQGSFFAWMRVTYYLYHQQIGSPTFTNEHTIVVLLIAVPFGSNSIVGGIGWEVSAWQYGTQTFPVPSRP